MLRFAVARVGEAQRNIVIDNCIRAGECEPVAGVVQLSCDVLDAGKYSGATRPALAAFVARPSGRAQSVAGWLNLGWAVKN